MQIGQSALQDAYHLPNGLHKGTDVNRATVTAGIYKTSGLIGSEILTSNPCGVFSEKETVPQWAFTI